jgi:hypothetical protein
VFPLQQPLIVAHDACVQMHCPPEHVWPLAHAMQAPPPEPHSASVTGFTQVDPLQQPLAQALVSQTH